MKQVPGTRWNLIRSVEEPLLSTERITLGELPVAKDRAEFLARFELRVMRDTPEARLCISAKEWPDALVEPFASGADAVAVDDGIARFEYPALLAGEVIHLEVGFALGPDRPSGICASIPWDLPLPYIENTGRTSTTRTSSEVRWAAGKLATDRIQFNRILTGADASDGRSLRVPMCTARLSACFEELRCGDSTGGFIAPDVHSHRALVCDVVSATAEFVGRWWPTWRLDQVLILTGRDRAAHHQPEAPGLLVMPRGFETSGPEDVGDIAYSIIRQLIRTWCGGLAVVSSGRRSYDYEILLAAVGLHVAESLGFSWPTATLGPPVARSGLLEELLRHPGRMMTTRGRAQYRTNRLAEELRQHGSEKFSGGLAAAFSNEIAVVPA